MDIQNPRIFPLAEHELDDDARTLLDLPLKGHQENTTSEFLRTIVRHPGLYRRYAPFAGKLLVAGKLPPRDRELAILRGAWLCRAPYEWGEHVRIAHTMGLSTEEIERITRGSSDPAWNADDVAVIRAVEELHAGSQISDATWAELVTRFNEQQLIELPLLIGAYQMIAYAQNALRTPLPAGNEGLSAR